MCAFLNIIIHVECSLLKSILDLRLEDYSQVEGGIRLIVGFQPLMVISLTASWIRWCMQVYACNLCGPVLFVPNDLRPTVFLGAKPPIQFRHR